ncbi:hypothetical protein ALQ65_102146 [Pseudomonas syringae pv. coriandricola]|uniref:Uncharacterized protein n=1 Tax=Pseudomonas syringae pv. coriandricola TaxID=264453 RepID=A0A0P9LGB1_9PSED|nr:hypothetical protein ALO76_102313 [Pseudomonas syringae pv. coriandricola]RMN07365.1 hypothetical protein ALQ65_102146 [Pseudomonas syringae pv. coriandricola]
MNIKGHGPMINLTITHSPSPDFSADLRLQRRARALLSSYKRRLTG